MCRPYFRKHTFQPREVFPTFNPSGGEVEAGESGVDGDSFKLLSESSLIYTRPCLKQGREEAEKRGEEKRREKEKRKQVPHSLSCLEHKMSSPCSLSQVPLFMPSQRLSMTAVAQSHHVAQAGDQESLLLA